MYEASACDKMPQKTEEYFYNQEHIAYVCNYTESEKTEWFFKMLNVLTEHFSPFTYNRRAGRGLYNKCYNNAQRLKVSFSSPFHKYIGRKRS